MRDSEHPAVVVLNRAFAADPVAIHSLVVNRVPCSIALAEDPTVVVHSIPCLPGPPVVGTLGLINGILGEMGLPLVACRWSDGVDEEGRAEFLGFTQYHPPL